jgi:hypothetical protein
MTGVRLGFTIGPLVAVYLYSAIGGVTPFIASAAFYILGIVLAMFLREKPPDIEDQTVHP